MNHVAQAMGRMWAAELARSPILQRAREEKVEVVIPDIRAPFAEYIDRPVDFVREQLGMDPWDRGDGMPPEYASQVEVLEAVPKHRRVADKAGQKLGKSALGAWTALWWMYTRVQGRVWLTAPTARQVTNILWTEIRLIAQGQHEAQRAKGFRPNLPGVFGSDPNYPNAWFNHSAHSGMGLGDAWEIVGVTTDDPDRMQGASGPRQLYIVDEASGYDEGIFQSVLGNLAGGGHILALGNPTQLVGTFYDAFHGKAENWKTFTQSSLENPNFYGQNIPGLANQEYATSALVDWGGPGNPIYDARVLGRFPSSGEYVVVPLALVEVGEGRWAKTPIEGRLEVGVDPSRGGDEAILAGRHGRWVDDPVAIHVDPSNTEIPPGHQVGQYVIGYVAKHAGRGGSSLKPRVKVDAIGIGSSVVDFLLAYLRECRKRREEEPFEVVAVVTSRAADERVFVNPKQSCKDAYHNLRTQLGFGVTRFLMEGGALPKNGKLHADLVAPKYYFTQGGKQAVEDKDEVKKRLRRSPDRGDAVALAIYEPPMIASSLPPPPLITKTYGSGMGWG